MRLPARGHVAREDRRRLGDTAAAGATYPVGVVDGVISIGQA